VALPIDQLVPGFTPETPLEQRLLSQPELARGLAWGKRRFGHPEGRVGLHVAGLMAAIDEASPHRRNLRLLALVHDSFKYLVRPEAEYSPDNDHAVLGRRFAERFIDDERVLAALELHDEPYWIWRTGSGRLEAVIERVPDLELYLRFVELDAVCEGKDPTLLWWVRREFAARGLLASRPPTGPVTALAPSHAGGEVVYVKIFTTAPESQEAVARACRQVITDGAAILGASGQVLRSDDGLRVIIVWRWRGASAPHLLGEAEVIGRAWQKHPALRQVERYEAHVFREVEAARDATDVGSRARHDAQPHGR
jgi:hypothetical protein